MKPLDYELLVDENIHPGVVDGLRQRRKRVTSTNEANLCGSTDVAVLRFARARNWVVITHDADFGRLAVRAGEPCTGIVYLRPGHIRPEFVLSMLDAIESTSIHVEAPFFVIAVRRGDHVKVRMRRGGL